jgi:hypothetical protein
MISKNKNNTIVSNHKNKYNNTINWICDNCDKEYKHQSSFSRHKKICISTTNIDYNNQQLEIEKLKNELTKQKLELKELEIKQLQLQLNTQTNPSNSPNPTNQTNILNNTTVNNVKNISKVQNLNINFGDVIDINTFIENYKNQYGLTNKQTEILLSNYKNNGINSCISSLVYYLKESAIQQYKELKGKEITMANIILPFILSDKCLREHFEKTINGNWDKTTVIDNIKKIVGITDDHVFKHQKTYMQLSDPQKKKLINGLLKASGYSKLSVISNPELYKIENDENIS